MPITSDLGGKDYTLGRGRLLFDRFAANVVVDADTRGEGERYLGNSPEFSLSSESESLDHYDSDAGVRVKDDSVQLSFEQTGSFSVDNINMENLALAFLGTQQTVTAVSATGVEETFTVKKGHFYQLGVSESQPAGVRKVASIVMKDDADVTIAASGNYAVDEARGHIYIEADAEDIDDGDEVEVTYNISASTRDRVISGSTSVYGSLRFKADNPKGPNRDYFFPYVKLTPDGDYALKGDEWQQMSFSLEVLKKSSNIAAMYIDGQPV